jgi:hypothetical protein
VITRYIATVDQKSVGLHVSVFISIKLARQKEEDLDRFARAIWLFVTLRRSSRSLQESLIPPYLSPASFRGASPPFAPTFGTLIGHFGFAMPSRPRASRLETPTARLRLLIAKKPHHFTTLAPGIALGYRRCKGPGRWVVRVADGEGGVWTKAFGLADDHEEADGETVLTFWQAQDKARSLARGRDSNAGKPGTVAEAIDDYEANLRARDADVANASRARNHLSESLLNAPVALLTAKKLLRWRDGLVERGMKPATVRRTVIVVRAVLNFAANHDPAIANRDAWRIGLRGGSLGNTRHARNVVLNDGQIRAVVAAAFSLDPALGLFVETCAVTGQRSSQIAKLTVADLLDNTPEPRLLMPSSKKGGHGRPPRARRANGLRFRS